MKVQFGFALFLVCYLLGELFAEVVEDSDYDVLDNVDSMPKRRTSVYDSGWVKDPNSKHVVYTRTWHSKAPNEVFVKASGTKYRKVQRYRQEKYNNLSAGAFTNIKNLPGQCFGKMCLTSEGNHSTTGLLKYLLRDESVRQVLRRMLNTDNPEEKDKMEDVQDC